MNAENGEKWNPIVDFIKSFISEYCRIDVDKIKKESKLTDLGMDSLDIIEFILAVEDKYDIEISDEDAEGFEKISDVIAFVNERV